MVTLDSRHSIEEQLVAEAHRQLGGNRPVCLDMLSDAYYEVMSGTSIEEAAGQLVIDTIYWDGGFM